MTTRMIRLTVNGAPVEVDATPRTSLADVLRGPLGLTGTHLGCEQGACGACTVLVDGVPARSCIGSSCAVDGAEIRTIEGFDDDPLMAELRRAFNLHHGLQCGFCTPGMMIMARDLVMRLPDADKDRIRLEMSGNLCRCTGYAGIVNAIHAVIEARTQGDAATSSTIHAGPAGGAHLRGDQETPVAPQETAAEAAPRATADEAPDVSLSPAAAPGEVPLAPSVHHGFVLDFPLSEVRERFRDVPFMISCIPGARLRNERADGIYEVVLKASMGPISAEFAGVAQPEWRDDGIGGTIRGRGQDRRSSTSARGEMTYELSESGATATQVDVHIGYALSGALGQFARGAIVRQFVALMVDQFADSFARNMGAAARNEAPTESGDLNLGRNAFQMLKILVMRLFGRR